MPDLTYSRARRAALALLLLCLSAAGAAAQQKHRMDFDELINETQKSSPQLDKMTIAWWVPEEFWREALAQEASVTPAQSEEFLEVLRPYALFIVVDGKMGALGEPKYLPEEAIRRSLQLSDAQGVKYAPIEAAKVSGGINVLLSMMKPVLSNMLGPLGQNMHFFLFPGRNKDGQRILNAAKEGSFSLRVGDEEFKWRLPLGSVLPPKACPVDGERMSGAWKFCPWHGEKLPAGPAR